jgi:hypothetical protein
MCQHQTAEKQTQVIKINTEVTASGILPPVMYTGSFV